MLRETTWLGLGSKLMPDRYALISLQLVDLNFHTKKTGGSLKNINYFLTDCHLFLIFAKIHKKGLNILDIFFFLFKIEGGVPFTISFNRHAITNSSCDILYNGET